MATLNIGADLKNYIINLIKSTVRDTYYPIGKTYITMGSEDPNKTIGGTWVKISGGYLYPTNSNVLGKTAFNGWGAQSGGNGNTGGTAITIDQMPYHEHQDNSYYGSPYSRRLGQWNVVNSGDRMLIATGGSAMGYPLVSIVGQGGGQAHNHTIPGHTHNIATIDVWLWKRTA